MNTVEHTYRHPIEDVFAKLVDEGHLRDRSEQAGHRKIEVKVEEKGGGYEIRIARDIDSQIPAIAKRFVSPVNHVVDIVRWRDAGDGKAGTYDIVVSSRIRISGEMTLKPMPDGCVYTDTCTPEVDMPLIGKRIAKIVAKETTDAIAQDCQRTERALAE